MRSTLFVLIAIFSVQAGASLAKGLFPQLGAIGVSTLRLGFSTLILGLVWRPWRHKITASELKSILAYGLALGVMNFVFYLALERLALGLAVALEFTGPLAVALFASRKPLDFLWAFLAMLGIVLILPMTDASKPVDLLGVVFALIAGAAWGFYIILGKKAAAQSHAGSVTSIGMAFGFCLALPFGIFHSGAELLNLKYLPVGLAVALFSSAIPYSLEMLALKHMPARNFGILMSLEPAVAALIGLVALQEHLSFLQWIAIASIMIASLGSSVSSSNDVKSVPES